MRVTFLLPGLHYGGVCRWALSLARNFRHVETASFLVMGEGVSDEIEQQAARLAPVTTMRMTYDPKTHIARQDQIEAAVEACRHSDAVIVSAAGILPGIADALRTKARIVVSHVTPEWDTQAVRVRADEQHATHLVAVSGAAAKCFAGAAQIIESGAEVDRVVPTAAVDWGFPKGAKVALYVGRFAPIKNQHLLLDALHHLPPSWGVVFVGALGRPEEIDAMIRRAADEHPGRVVFSQATPHVGNALAAADCLVITSHAESTPLVLVEGLLAKVPVVTTSYEAVETMARQHGRIAEIVPQGAHPAEFADAIARSQQDYTRVLHGFDVAWNHYTAAAMAHRWETYLLSEVPKWQASLTRPARVEPIGQPQGEIEWVKPRNEERLKVCLLANYVREFGGVEEWIELLVRTTRQAIDWHVSFFGRGEISEGYAKRLALAGIEWSQGDVAKAQAADAVLVWGVPQARGLLRGFTGQVALIAHACTAWSRQWFTPLERWADARCAVSAAAARAMYEKPESVILLPNGVSRDRMNVTIPRDDFRMNLGLRTGEIAVGYVGRLSLEKNPLLTAQACAELGSPFRAVYFGVEPKWAATYPQQIQKICPRALLLPPHRQIGNIFDALDCMVVGSHEEGFSMVTIEAMWGRCPVVSTPVGGLPDLEAQFGQLTIPLPLNPTATQAAEAIGAACRPDREPIVERAAAVVRDHYSDDAFGERWVRFFLELTGRGSCSDQSPCTQSMLTSTCGSVP